MIRQLDICKISLMKGRGFKIRGLVSNVYHNFLLLLWGKLIYPLWLVLIMEIMEVSSDDFSYTSIVCREHG